MYDPAGAAIRVTLPPLPEGFRGSQLAIQEGQSVTMRFERTDGGREATFAFLALAKDDALAAQFFGYDPARPPTIHFAAGDTAPKFLTIGAVENITSDGYPQTQWHLEPISGVSRFDGFDGMPGSAELLPVIFLNNDVSAGRDIVFGGPGDDIFVSGGPSGGGFFYDSFYGSYGIDTLVLSGQRAEYGILRQSPRLGGILITDLIANRDDTDEVQTLERVRFTDGVLALDRDGHAGQAYRLYQAAFGRDPDVAGLAHQVEALDAGISLNTIAANFIASAEFVALSGAAPSNAEFITLLYREGLGREPDGAGFQAQLEGLSAGLTRDQLLINFSESQENQGLTSLETYAGIWLGSS